MIKSVLTIIIGIYIGYLWGEVGCAARWNVLSDPGNWRATNERR